MRLTAARPANGYLIHAVRDAQTKAWTMTRARALCGVRGVDSWGFGGMLIVGYPNTHEPIEFGKYDRDGHHKCSKCTHIAARQSERESIQA